MRTVVSGAEVAHLWANQSQSEARTSNGNFYFDGNKIYSYGSHYIAGTIVYNERGERAYVINNTNYSKSTAKQLCYVRRAIPGEYKMFYSDDCETPYFSDGMLLNSRGYDKFIIQQLQSILDGINKQNKARAASYIGNIENAAIQLKKWINFWGIERNVDIYHYFGDTSLLQETALNLNRIYKQVMEIYEEIGAGCGEKIYQICSGNIETAALDEIREANKRLKKSIAERDARIAKERIEKWVNFETNYLEFKGLKFNTLVRYNESTDMIETSKGIKITIDEARKVWRFLSSVLETGKFHREVVVDRNGSKWMMQSLKNGILTAGCHVMDIENLKSVAAKLKF